LAGRFDVKQRRMFCRRCAVAANCAQNPWPGAICQWFYLVDEAHLKRHDLPEVRNLAEALFRLERSRTPGDIFAVMHALNAMLQGPQMQPLRRTLSVWLKMLLRRKAPGANMADIEDINDLLEADTIFATCTIQS